MTTAREVAEGPVLFFTGTYNMDVEDLFDTDRISYGWVSNRKWGKDKYVELIMVDQATGSDYSGGTYNKANRNVLLALAEEEGLLGSEMWDVYGGHGTYGIAVLADSENEELINALSSLADYPLLDEHAQIEEQMEAENEAWESWVRSDFTTALEKRFGFIDDDLNDLDEDALFEIFRQAMENSNTYWEEESGANMYIDLKRVVEGVDEDEFFAALEKAYGYPVRPSSEDER
jgi:hypothetical protein